MGSPYRRIDPDTRAVIVKDLDGNVIKGVDLSGADTDFRMSPNGLMVHDLNLYDVMKDILSELRIMNTHLQIITDEEIK